MPRDRRSPRPEPIAAKVPEVTPSFWVAKVLTTGMGEAAADALAKVNIFLAGFVGLVAFAVAMNWQWRTRSYRTAVYWFAVAMVAVFGTMVADGLHVVFRVPYAASSAACAIALFVIFRRWYRSEGTLSIHSIVTRRRERFYWLTVLATFALGTALGDLVATTLRLGFLGATVLFAALIAVPAIGWRVFRLHPVVAFWSAYVLTRPLGASIADLLGKPHSFGHGLGYGDARVAAVATVLIVVVVAYIRRRNNDVQPIDVDEEARTPRLLYHYTTAEQLPALIDLGQLTPEPITVLPGRSASLPHAIWLTEDGDGQRMPAAMSALSADGASRPIQITVAVFDALRWPMWADIEHLPRSARRAFDGTSELAPERFWLASHPIPVTSWLRVVDTATKRELWRAHGELPSVVRE